MKHSVFASMTGALLLGLVTLGVAQQSDSLGDYARTIRKDKKPTVAKQYDNDNLPREDKLSVVGNATEPAAPQAGQGNAQANKESKEGEVKPGQTKEERQQAYDEWKSKISAQKDKIDLLSRELDVLQREYRLRAAAFYADAGNRLRGSANWDKEDAQYKQQIDDKQKAVDSAKQELDDMQEQARKAGAPASVRE